MRRDPWPIALASATAVVSCGLMALAIAHGWLGPDVGRGARFCEAARDWAVRQPANTFSNLGFVAAGLLIAGHASRRPRPLGQVMPRGLATVMACVVVLLGPGSAAMHATQSRLGAQLDQLSMAFIAAFAAGYALMRWRRAGPQLFAGVFVGGVAFCVLMRRLPVDVPVIRHGGNLAFALLLVTAIGLELAMVRRSGVQVRPAFVYGSVAAMVTAFAIWNAAQAGLCDPHSLLQGHAAWHLLSALAAYLLYRYYASEHDASEHDASEEVGDPASLGSRGPMGRPEASAADAPP